MTTTPIFLKELSFILPSKTCFEDFNTVIHSGDRIGIIGRNGSGKTSLLKMITSILQPSAGYIQMSEDTVISYIPQVIDTHDNCSGGERFNKALTEAISKDPDVLLLDEPTNHLDRSNRRSLMRMLRSFPGTLIIVSHDRELLRTCTEKFWHLEDRQVRVFTGNYDDYTRSIQKERHKVEEEIRHIDRRKKQTHHDLMREQHRASQSKKRGQKSIDQRKWPAVVSKAKATRGEQTSGRKKAAIEHKKQELSDKLQSLRLPEIITPHFNLPSGQVTSKMLVSIADGSVGYDEHSPLLSGIHLQIEGTDRRAVVGRNGSGKTTLIKALMKDSSVYRHGTWTLPSLSDIGYLDQHYSCLDPDTSVFDSIASLIPSWSQNDVRKHLNDFLFRSNEEVHLSVKNLSGGEKARLSLAQIAAKPPKLLILDEITNNLDLETVEHITQVLKNFPGAMIIISHDDDFIAEIGEVIEVSIENYRVKA